MARLVLALVAALLAAGCLSAADPDAAPPAPPLPYERHMVFQATDPDVDHPFWHDGERPFKLDATDWRPGGRSGLRITLVDPWGQERGECLLRGVEPGGSCSFGGNDRPAGLWHVRYQPTGPLAVTVRVTSR